jgi:hypothetical protein
VPSSAASDRSAALREARVDRKAGQTAITGLDLLVAKTGALGGERLERWSTEPILG